MAQVSEGEKKMLEMQYQLRKNNDELKDFLKDMESWEEDIKQTDTKLKDKKQVDDTKLPPVRNSLEKKKKKKIKKDEQGKSKPKRISSYDYRSWDKFDVDKACESDGESSGSEYETDEEWEDERKKQAAVLEKDKGNDFFKRNQFADAIECYTKGANLDPTNPLLPANRAMALLKQNKYAAAELDCSVALTLDPLYTKAYLRRGTARMGLQKYVEAKADYERVLQLEPQNKKAKTDLETIEKALAKESLVSHAEVAGLKDEGIVKAVFKAPHERSKKSLRRIQIEEVGLDDDNVRQSDISRVTASQSEAKRSIVEREEEMFQKFTAHSPADIAPRSPADILVNSPADITPYSQADITKSVSISEDRVSNDKSISERLCDTKLTLNDTADSNTKTCYKDRIDKSHTASRKDVSPKTSPRQMCVPTSSIQFLSDYKLLKEPESFFQYFKNIKPADYVRLFGQFLDAEVLMRILCVIKDFYIRDGVEYFETLQGLTKVHRFSMVAMFLSKKDKQVLGEIFQHLRSSNKTSEKEISGLAAKFDLR